MERADDRRASGSSRAGCRLNRPPVTPEDSWQSLRQTDHDIALCLLFTTAKNRPVIADIFSLAHELENAIRIPSEMMLAAIRLQWWSDALTSDEESNVPLMQRLQQHMTTTSLTRSDLITLVEAWQNRLTDDNLDASSSWTTCWQLAARLSHKNGQDDADINDIARVIGDAFIAIRSGSQSITPPSMQMLQQLKGGTGEYRWLYLAGCLARYQLQSGQRDDPLLAWRLLCWRFGVKPPGQSPSP